MQTIYSDYVIHTEVKHKALLDEAQNSVGHHGAEQMVKRLHSLQ